MSQTTTSFLQIYPDFFNSKEESELYAKNYNKKSTNPRYKNFRQTNFTAGDEEQFENYRCDKNGNEIDVKITNENLFYDNKIFLEWDKFKNINSLSVSNTFKYIFYKFKKGIFIKIINNKLKVFLPISNVNFVNEWSDNIKVDNKYKNFNAFFKHISQLEGRNFNEKHINNYKNSWYSNNCLIRYEFPVNEGDTNVSVIKNMFEELCEKRKVPDIEFFINRRDFPLFNKNGYEPYYHLWNSTEKPLLSHNYDKYSPIFSMSSSEEFADIVIPTYEDWIRVQNIENKWFPKSRQNYEKNIFDDTKWKDKKPTAVFRGSSTGEGVTISTNQRLNLAHLSSITPLDENNIPYLDAGITKWNIRPKKLIDTPYLQTVDKDNFNFDLLEKMTPLEQSKYKYIIHVEGHVSAFRLSYSLGMNCVILLVDSKWKMWYSNILKPYIHFVPVKEDLSDLVERIKWCRNNDKQCENISKNCLEFYNKYLQKDGILDYLQKILIDTKKEIGIYFYNKIKPFEIQTKTELKILLNKKVDKIDNIYSIPNIERCYGLLKGIQLIIDVFINNLYFKNIINDEIIFKNKLGLVKKFNFANFDFAVKSTNNINKIKEHIHEAYIGINCINDITKEIPNFAYIFGIYKEDETINVITEYIYGGTLQQYIMSEKFVFKNYLLIIIQICLALEVAQQKCGFIHYDLTPWNIILKFVKVPIYVDYLINDKIISIKTNIIPIIIDYGKSHAVYNNKHFGFVNMFKYNTSFDMLSIFITSIYEISINQNLTKYDFINLLKLSNFITKTSYCKYPFKNSKDIKEFFYSAKKYSNLLNENKYELEEFTPINLVDYINKNLNYNIHINYKDNYCSYMNNKADYNQIFNYSLENKTKNKINTYTNVFKNIKKIDFSKMDHIFLIYYLQNLENILIYTKNNMILEVKKECLSTNKYERLFNNSMVFLKNIFETIKFEEINIEIYKIDDNFVINNYNETIFLDQDKIKETLILINKSCNINIDINLKNILKSIYDNDGEFKLIGNIRDKIKEKLHILYNINTYKYIHNKANIDTFIEFTQIIYNINKESIINKDDLELLPEIKKYYNDVNDIIKLIK
jgi:hypothetical protein